MKQLTVRTSRIVSHNIDNSQNIETITQKLSPEMTINKFIKYLPNQGYRTVEVVKVEEINGKVIKEIEEKEKYQSLINKQIKPIKKGNVDYKALSEKQSDLLEQMEQKFNTLEQSTNEIIKSKIEEALKLKEQESTKVDEEKKAAREEYKQLFGELPSSAMKLETLKQKIEEKKAELANN